MECKIRTRSITVNKIVSTVDTKASMKGMAGCLSTHKEDFSERVSSQLSYVEGIVSRLSEVNKYIQVRETSVGLDKVEVHSGPPDEYTGGTAVTYIRVAEMKSKKYLADMLWLVSTN